MEEGIVLVALHKMIIAPQAPRQVLLRDTDDSRKSACCTDVCDAVKHGHLECSTNLLSAGSESAALGAEGQSALAAAAFVGNAEIVHLLLQQTSVKEMAVQVSLRSEYHPLLCAVLSGSPEVLELLLDSQFREKMQGVGYLQAPSFASTGEDDIECAPWGPLCLVGVLLNIRPVPEHLESLLQMLLKAGFSANSLQGLTMPPLLLALLLAFDEEHSQHTELVGRLVCCLMEYEANPTYQYLAHFKYGWRQLNPSALALALQMRSWPALREMLKYVADAPLSLLTLPGVGDCLDPQGFAILVPQLIDYGWQHGTPWMDQLMSQMKFILRQGAMNWGEHVRPVSAIVDTLNSPCSLRKLTRLSVRELHARAAWQSGSSLPLELQANPDLPPGIKPFLLLQEP